MNRLRKATLLALFALFSMQVAIAGHQFEHSAASAVESCDVCVQADRLDDAVANILPTQAIHGPQQNHALPFAVRRVDGESRQNFQSRAPPTL